MKYRTNKITSINTTKKQPFLQASLFRQHILYPFIIKIFRGCSNNDNACLWICTVTAIIEVLRFLFFVKFSSPRSGYFFPVAPKDICQNNLANMKYEPGKTETARLVLKPFFDWGYLWPPNHYCIVVSSSMTPGNGIEGVRSDSNQYDLGRYTYKDRGTPLGHETGWNSGNTFMAPNN